MIDKLVLHIPFKIDHLTFVSDDKYYLDINKLPAGIRLVANVFRDSSGTHVEDLRTCFETLPSSHSGMAMKIYDLGMNCDPFIMIKCSPAKLLQGHNLYGFDDIAKSGLNMIALLSATHPELYEMLDVKHTEVSEFDVTYSTFIENPETKKLFLSHMRNTSNGHTKNRGDNYETSIYFGAKNSRLKKTKIYSKIEEMHESIKKAQKMGYLESVEIMKKLLETDYCKQAIRFESTIKKRYLERRAIPTNFFKLCNFIEKMPDFYEMIFIQSWKEIFEALSGMHITKTDDKTVYKSIYDAFHTVDKNGKIRTTTVNRLFNVYMSFKNRGFDVVRESMKDENGRVNSTFNRAVSDLVSCGFSRSHLQNLNNDSGSVVIQISRFINIDFSKQVPDGYVIPDDLYAA